MASYGPPANNLEAPFSEEAETAVLGCIILDPDSFVAVSGIIRSADDFFLLRHNVVWQAMERLNRNMTPLDPITLADCLESSGDLANIGGLAYLINLANSIGTAMHAEVYAELVRNAAIRRQQLVALNAMCTLILDEELSLDEVREQTDAAWLAATSLVQDKRGAWMQEAMSDFYDEMNHRMAHRLSRGIPSGLRDLDQLLAGFAPETLTVLAGRPGMGKSALMDTIALNIAGSGIPIFYATSERSITQVLTRMSAMESGINTQKLKFARTSHQEGSQFMTAVGVLSNYPIYFDDDPMPTPQRLYATAKWLVERHGVQMILFDGMYRACTGNPRLDDGGNDHKKYGEIALQLKTLARRLHIPLLVTHQLNRNLENRSDKRPVLSDLRESGRIEEEADNVLFLYRDEVYNKATEFPNQADIIFSKHRDGPTGTVSLFFEKSLTKFVDGDTHYVDLSDLE